jgi:hypothetical protein
MAQSHFLGRYLDCFPNPGNIRATRERISRVFRAAGMSLAISATITALKGWDDV